MGVVGSVTGTLASGVEVGSEAGWGWRMWCLSGAVEATEIMDSDGRCGPQSL